MTDFSYAGARMNISGPKLTLILVFEIFTLSGHSCTEFENI